MANATTVSIIKEECFLDDIINELPNKVAKPPTVVKANNPLLPKLFHQISDSLKEINLIYTCLDASSLVIALGTNVGNAFIYQRNHKKILKISSDTKYVPTTCIKLAAGCGLVAFAHESGTFSVGLVDPPIHRAFDSLTAHDVHCVSVTCLEWSTDGLILYAGDSDGTISMSVVKISEGILQAAIIIKESVSIVQVSYRSDALLVSTVKRTIIWNFQSEKIIQVGEKERKITGSFGCCFIPDNLQESSKKLYAARPGQRIWTADESGKVSSTSVFKPLLADKPQTIYTLTGNDNKMNSGGQFGHLLVYYNKFVVTWDQNHLWVLDLCEGTIIGCHSNLGKIRNAALSGHELFILVNQKERFLRRFTLVSEDLGPMCLDAVIAIHEDVVKTSPFLTPKFKPSSEPEAVVAATMPTIVTEDKILNQEQEINAPMDNAFDRIKSIPLELGKDGIVFTGGKRKKKERKKVKQGFVSDGVKTLTTHDEHSELRKEPVNPESNGETLSKETTSKNEIPKVKAETLFKETTSKNEIPLKVKGETLSKETTSKNEIPKVKGETLSKETTSKNEIPKVKGETLSKETTLKNETPNVKGDPPVLLGNIASKDEINNKGDPPSLGKLECSANEIQDGSPVLPEVSGKGKVSRNGEVSGEGELHIMVPHEVDAKSQEVHRDTASNNETARKLNEQPNLSCGDDTIECSSDQLADASYTQKDVNDVVVVDHEITMETSTPQHVADRVPTSPLRESVESVEELRIMLEESSNYLRSDSYDSKKPETRSQARDIEESEEGIAEEEGKDGEDKKEKKNVKQDLHVPLLADTWSRRAVPTTQIASLAISENYVFCVDAQGEVYYSDPNTMSCHGWEQVDFKATQLCVNSSCNLISYVQEDNKAFIRGNVSTQYPVGNKSFLITEDVALLATCSVCTWAITTSGDSKRADSATLLELEGDVKYRNIWRHEDSQENLCQIACYNNVLWGRTIDESLFVYTGRSGGKKTTWKKVEDKKAKWISMSDDGTIWIITPDDHIWFNPGVSTSLPTGEVWHQVTLGDYIIDDDASIVGSAVNFFQSVGSAYRSARTTEYLRHAAKGFLQSTKDMACSMFRDGGSPKQVYCNTKSGVWLLDTRNTLHACRGQVTGTYWKLVCPTGTAQSATWLRVSSGLGAYVWAVQPNGELTCFNPNGPSYNVAAPSSTESLDFISSSPHGLWCFASERSGKRVHIRDGITDSYPQGFAWFSLKLHDQGIQTVKHFSVGRITVWAVDGKGDVWIRIGNVNGDQSSVLSQAWLPIESPPPHVELSAIEVDAKDTMVWAIDTKGSVYARDGVSEGFLIGRGWREVAGVPLKSVCLGSGNAVYGLCANGEIVCRFGVSHKNSIGDYWKKIPGDFAQISVNDFGELWGISHEGRLFVRKTKFGIAATKDVKEEVWTEKETHVADDGVDDDDGDWELL